MLITDRTQYHVDLLNNLRKKTWAEMSASERELWNTEASKGAYNYTDLNRVEMAVGKIAELFNYPWGDYPIKTDWTPWDIPKKTDMERYLDNLQRLIDWSNWSYQQYPERYPQGLSYIPRIPQTMENLTYQGANNIEKALEVICKRHSIDLGNNSAVLGTAVLGTMVLGGE